MLVNITVIVPQTKEIEDALSNSWGVVAGISNAWGLAVRAVMVAWSLVPVGSSAVGPALVTTVMMVRL